MTFTCNFFSPFTWKYPNPTGTLSFHVLWARIPRVYGLAPWYAFLLQIHKRNQMNPANFNTVQINISTYCTHQVISFLFFLLSLGSVDVPDELRAWLKMLKGKLSLSLLCCEFKRSTISNAMSSLSTLQLPEVINM